MKELIEKLENELWQQTRNGRTEVYIEADDLNKIGYGIDPNKKGRVWVDAAYLRIVLNRLKFKEDLKVETISEEIDPIQNHQTYREFIGSLRNKEISD